MTIKTFRKWLQAGAILLLLPTTMHAQSYTSETDAIDTEEAGDFQKESRHNFEVSKNMRIFNDLYSTLDLYYVDTLNAKSTIGNAISYMLYNIDPYTEYYNEDSKEELQLLTSGKYAGMGAVIGYKEAERRCYIDQPYEHMPAAEAGLRKGDVLLSIDGKDFGEADEDERQTYTSKVTASLRGEPGTTMVLTVKRPDIKKPLDVIVTRRIIEMPNVALSKLYADSIGYVYLSTFNDRAAGEMRDAVNELRRQGAKRLILDLRNNPGGIIDQAVDIANMFLPKNKLVASIKGKNEAENQDYITRQEPIDTLMPLAVLVNGSSASAAEVLSGALQDYDRAVIIGKRTYGKGLVQQIKQLTDDAKIKLTIAKYYIPSGRCIQAYTYKDGVPQHLPDSVAKKFETAAGRAVYDGGGIAPDIIVKTDSLPNFFADIDDSDILTDYCAEYVQKHPKLNAVSDIHLTDAEYAEFTAYMKAHNFSYETSSKRTLKFLKDIIAREGYKDVTKDELDALEKKLADNIDYDFAHWKDDIKDIVERNIAEYAFFSRGAVELFLKKDPFFLQGLSTLQNNARYHELLRGTE